MNAVCSCCGESTAQGSVHLFSHREIEICYRCLDWLNAQRDKQHSARGGARITGVEVEFSVGNLDRALDHYERLGFRTERLRERLGFAQRDDCTILLRQADQERRPGWLYLHVDEADELTAEWRKAGLEVTGPEDFDYGKREGSHTDLDGNLIRFASPLRATD